MEDGTVPHEELLRRLGLSLLAVVVLVVALAAGGLVTSNLTRDRTLKQLNANISRCLVRPAALSPADARYCSRPEVFGDLYAQTQQQSAAALAANNAQEARLGHLEAEVRDLKRQVEQGAGQPPGGDGP